jgi:hypothetical protein
VRLIMCFGLRFIIVDDNGRCPVEVPRCAGSPHSVALLHQYRPARARNAPFDGRVLRLCRAGRETA